MQDLKAFLKEVVVSTLFDLDLKDPDHVHLISDDIGVTEVGPGRFSTDGVKLLAEELGVDASGLAREILILFELEDFIARAAVDETGIVFLDLVIERRQ